ncbi:MAG: hypothetical protein HPY75_09735 [Actinobacteria bacterium]|nr:hypothetical protein [Actinomycetota bacterium]
MGTLALLLFLGSLALGLAALVVLVFTGLGVWRTLRYGYKDFRAWSAFFGEYAANLGAALEAMEERVRSIAAHGNEVREGVEEIMDAVEELRSHPLLRAARFVGRFRA